MITLKSLIIHSRQSSSVIIGLCIGIAISIIQTPFIEDDCTRFDQFSGKLRDLRSDGTVEEDYEPKLIIDNNYNNENIPKSSKAQKILRPRYYSTELGIREKLLVAVISSKETIGSFGIAINKTLHHHVDKLIFFIDGIGSQKLGLDIPVVGFKDTKPLIKIFRVFSYLSENYLNEYDYFLVVSDHTYVNGRKIYDIVQHISISEHVHMGKLMENPESFYCSVDSGIILSHSILQAVISKLNWCTRNTYSETDTDNLGRCILHATDKPCFSSLQGRQYVSYRLRDDAEVESHLQLIGTSSLVREAATVSNVAEASDMYILHKFYLQEELKRIDSSISKARNEISRVRPYSPRKKAEETWPVGSAPAHRPATRFDIIRWDTFNGTHIFYPDDFHNTRPVAGADLLDIMGVVNASILYITKTRGNLEYRGIEYGHRRLDPTRGVDYLLSLIFRDNTSGQTVTRKFEATRPLTEPEMIPMPYVTENTRVTLVLPVIQADIIKATEFINRYEVECMEKGEHTFLLLILLYSPGTGSGEDSVDEFKVLKDLALKYTRKHHDSGSKIGWMTIHMLQQKPSDFAIMDLVMKKFQEETLILMTKHLAHLSNDFLNRVRMNTILNWQVFSPVPFTQYHPSTVDEKISYQKLDVSRTVGHFDRYNFDHLSFYAGDYVTARNAAAETIPHIRVEGDLKLDRPEEYDFNIYGLFLQASNLHILRAAEPSLKLEYQDIDCTNFIKHQSEQQHATCLMQQGSSLGLRSQLSKLILKYLRGEKEQ